MQPSGAVARKKGPGGCLSQRARGEHMVVEKSKQVSALQVLRWVLLLYRNGVREAAGISLDIRPYPSPLGTSLAFGLNMQVGDYQTVVMHGQCRDALSGPLQINGYVLGLWTADLHRAAILAYDDPEDEA